MTTPRECLFGFLFSVFFLFCNPLSANARGGFGEQGSFAMPPVEAELLPVRIVSPVDGSELNAGPVTFVFAPRLNWTNHQLCFTVQNKRESYHAFTKCLANVQVATKTARRFHLAGFKAGIWNARAYLVEPGHEEARHWRGGHLHTVGGREGQHCITFIVDLPGWQREAWLDMTSKVPSCIAQQDSSRYKNSGDSFVKEICETVEASQVARFPRLEVFKIANAMRRSAAIQDTIRRQSMYRMYREDSSKSGLAHDSVIVTMANAGHMQLALNWLSSLRQVRETSEGIIGAVVFTLDGDTARTLESFSASVVRVPHISSYCGHCAGNISTASNTSTEGLRDVWSKGFADIVILKPACVLTVLRLGIDVLWSDTDVFFFRDPFEDVLKDISSRFTPGKISIRTEPPDFTIQAAGDHDLHYPADEAEAFLNELCTGLFFARANDRTVEFFLQVVHTLSLFSHDQTFGDQSATNIVLFEKRWRYGISNMTVAVLDPLLFPSGGIYFRTNEHQRHGVTPALVHNNYVIGRNKKIARFKEHGLWLLEDGFKSKTLTGHSFTTLRGLMCGLTEGNTDTLRKQYISKPPHIIMTDV